MSEVPLYHVNWRRHSVNFLTTVKDLFDSNLLTDITLVMDEDSRIRCHKIVLASCSEYFRNFIVNFPEAKSIVLYGIKYSEMKALLDFMYTGEMKIAQTDLEQVTKMAKFLRVKGLTMETEPMAVNMGSVDLSSTSSSMIRNNTVITSHVSNKKYKVAASCEQSNEAHSSSMNNMDINEERHR